MTSVEELKSMPHEDLVRRIQELEESNENLKKKGDDWCKFYTNIKTEYDSLTNAIHSILTLVKK